jgi:NADH dehydrogenase
MAIASQGLIMTGIPSTRLVTIFGGSGFLGRHMVRALANEGWRIRVATRRPNNALFLRPMGRVGQIQLFKANVQDDEAVRAALKGADAAINLVGVLYQSGNQRFESLHVEAAERIARAARELGVKRLLHVSALGIAGSGARYARTKALGEERVRAEFPDATIFRPSTVFGPEDDFFNKFGWLARLSPALPLIGGGKTKFQPVFVGDVARAAVKVLGDSATASKTYELGGPEIMTLKEIMELTLKETRRHRLLIPVPFGLARIKAVALGLLPKPLLTVDQVRMLEGDAVVSDGALTFRNLGIVPEAPGGIVPSYLWRFRKHGEFEPAAN